MKKYTILFLLTALIFGTLTMLTATHGRQYDGNDYYGFPFAFHTKYSEMVYPSPAGADDLVKTNYLFLLFDVLLAFLLSFALVSVYEKIKRKNKSIRDK